jgi:hypothetical protein
MRSPTTGARRHRGHAGSECVPRGGDLECLLRGHALFRGTLLGAGGLVRAYSAARPLALEAPGTAVCSPWVRAGSSVTMPKSSGCAVSCGTGAVVEKRRL